MAVAVLLAVLVVGVGSVVKAVLVAVRRDRHRGSLSTRGEPASAEAAVLIAAVGYGPGIAETIEAAARLVPRGDVVVAADPATIEHARGVNTVTVVGDPTAAVAAAMAEFRLADRYGHVLVLDPDHRPGPRFLDRTLPLFSDPEVAAVAGYARTEWSTAGPGPLTAYRERALTVQQWLLTAARTRPGIEMTRTLASPARLYRAAVLDRLAPEPTDLHTSGRLHGLGLGRVIVVRGAVVDTRDPDRLGPYFRQLRQWSSGLRQARREADSGLLTAYVVEQTLTALALLAAPVLAVTGVLSWQSVVLGLVVPDYALTLLIALLRRDHRFLVPGLVFPAIRLLDAAAFLVPARRGGLAPVRPARPPRPSRARRVARPVAVLGWAAAVTAAAGLVWRVAATSLTLPATPAEPLLVDAAYGRIASVATDPAPDGLAALGFQLITHSGLSGAFGRHGDVLTGAREFSVVLCGIIVLALVVTAMALRLRPWAIAAALVAAVVAAPVVVALTPVGPGVAAAAWLAVAAVPGAFLTRSLKPLTGVVLAVAGAVVTSPALVLPVAVGFAGWAAGARATLPGWRHPVAVAVPLLVGGGAFAVFSASGLLDVPTAAAPAAAVLTCAVVCVGGLGVRRARPVAAGVLAALAVDAPVLLPCAIAGAVLVLAVLLDETTRAIPAGGAFLVQRAAVVTAATGALAVAALGAGATAPTAPRVDHRALAAWFAANAHPDTELSAPPLLRSDLHRDLGEDRVRSGGDTPLTVLTQAASGLPVAEFAGATVRLNGTAGGYAASADRAVAGRRLADNSRLSAPEPVRSALRSGDVDLRLMTVIAQLTAAAPVSVGATFNPPAEAESDLPHRSVLVSEVDGLPLAGKAAADELRDWLAAQRGPYAPDAVTATPDGLVLTWRLPPLPL